MFRKLILATAATAVLGAAALAPTAASAHWHGHYWGHHWHGGFYGPVAYVGGPDCYLVKRIVDTPVGPRPRLVTVCD